MKADVGTGRPKILVSDTAFVAPERLASHDLVSIFPMKPGDGAYRATLDALLYRSRLQSSFYDSCMASLPEILGPCYGAYRDEGGQVVRLVLVAVTTLFLDRSLRLLTRMHQWPEHAVVAAVEPIIDIQWFGEIKNTASRSWHLNQELFQRAAEALGVPRVALFKPDEYPEFPREAPVRNMLFDQRKRDGRWLASKLRSRLNRLASRIPGGDKPYLAFGFAYDEQYILERGLYGLWGPFQKMEEMPEPVSATKDSALRAKLLDDLVPELQPAFAALLRNVDATVTPQQSTQLGNAFAELFVDWFPIGFLEGFATNVDNCSLLERYPRASAIIGSELCCDAGYFLSARARAEGKTVIGVQHGGGHLGYIEDMSINGELEFPVYDELITWGWTRFDAHFPIRRMVPLPSPRYSETPLKSDYLPHIKRHANSLRDVLFLSNLFHRFPHPSTCGQARADFIDEITDSQEAMVAALNRANISVDHKPYSMRYLGLYPDYFMRLEKAGVGHYRLVESTQKGLTVDLVKTCKIVLWDQPGSGWLECLVSGIPTMAYWTRIYSREAPWAKELVGGLELCGVIHSDPRHLADEIKNYLVDPEAWMLAPDRLRAIASFCDAFGRTSRSWRKDWTRGLSERM